MKRIWLAAALLGGLTACAEQANTPGLASGQVLRISPGVWDWYEQYKSHSFPLYFAISADGNYAGYTYCPDTRCVDEMGRGRTNALTLCERGGDDCLIFAYRGVIKVAYEVRSY